MVEGSAQAAIRADGHRLFEWNHVLGDLLARAAPFFERDFVRKELLAAFLTEDEEGLGVLAEFADKTVTRHVLDAPVIPANTFDLLNDCVERVVGDPVFDPDGYRAGQLHGFDMPKLIKALLFVAVDKEAPGAARFANGDWSQIGVVMPVVTRMITGRKHDFPDQRPQGNGSPPFVDGSSASASAPVDRRDRLCDQLLGGNPGTIRSTQARSRTLAGLDAIAGRFLRGRR